MGMDVFGKAPVSEMGEYFRANVWGWHPLATYCELMAPEITKACKHWHTNDGDGLDANGSALLAAALDKELTEGRTAFFIKEHRKALDELPDRPCVHCSTTGTRHDGLKLGKETADFQCNACGGKGYARPFEASYYLEESTVREFKEFLEHCGGFRIN